jgi:hypothetical protein
LPNFDFLHLGARDLILLVLILLAVYLVVSLLRLAQVRLRHGIDDTATTLPATPSRTRSYDEPTLGATSLPQAGRSNEMMSEPTIASFEMQLFRSQVEAELQGLRQDVAELRQSLAQLTATRRVAPQYNEAMLLAQQGMPAQTIADQCHISIGEADLVVALARSRQEYQDHQDHDRQNAA